MLEKLIQYSINHKLIILLFTLGIIGFGLYSLTQIPIGAVPDITNNQVQVITTSRNLATEDVEKYLTYPVELEMANLPGVKEIRSISKFGLSVVTIVFDDDMGTYLPRQLIAEKIKNAESKIPAEFGQPFMGPVSTGLGEIYQYIIDVDEAHKDQYSITDLRTIQDWVVRRQLSGIKGVVEVNTWGGYLKQYEVAINPERLRAMGIDVSEVYTALKKNNNVAGGGYIEKVNESYFIRSEGLVTTLEDIRNIVITNTDGTPVYVRDIGEVNFGHATRFGAITANGEGEKVLGQVMMLKDANSNATIERVRARVEEIQSSLPKGIQINGFLDRSELIGRTTFTIAENLILGCLIVIFIVVLLLGNLRSGLVVASVIPLSLLFALSLMNIFGVDANLMSLGAIDFGIIIDGAVIIVEFIAYKITLEQGRLNHLPKAERKARIDTITFNGASKMMRSAIFGQIIIIIVFIPILALTGVEGKMFRPMALVFIFALAGTMLFGFTYVPVVSSMFLRPTKLNRKNISRRLITFLEKLYQPSVIWALRYKRWVLSMTVVLLVLAIWLFSHMGAEFVPTLDEGDFVIQPVLKTGTSLSKTIETTTQIEKILKTFPEVKNVVSRIGAAEVPTDPMSMEESDVIITLNPKKDWVTAKSKDELADKFKEALQVIPGIDYEFTQPIEMRFNELITGVRADLAIKIFGEDLDILFQKGKEVQEAIRNIEGASDIILEKIAGLPQMRVKYDRRKIAKYGLNIDDLNDIISMGFAGLPAGTVFEGEKQFDLVIRYDNAHRKDIQNIENASIMLKNGSAYPLSEFADISYSTGPAKISRDETKRRVVVSVNVRGRDLESVVNDVQNIINEKIDLPPGYSITYGGQFENLQSARARGSVAVPIALFLIFVLLYFAFGSLKEALIVFSAIPLSVVGGIFLLYLRGMPFSISAGIGFIALFGIAVLNGIVLIENFKELKAKGLTNMNKRIIIGTKERMRPVLLTAGAAAMGFLPMAISTSAGAEVQRPLATVVIGGLVSATFLTLIVLPVLYAIFDSKPVSIPRKGKKLLLFLFGLILIPGFLSAQQIDLSMDQAVELALKNNANLKASKSRVDEAKQLVGSSFDLDKTLLYYSYDENNMAHNGNPLNVWGLNQSFKFPTVYAAQKKLQKSNVSLQNEVYNWDEQQLRKEVMLAYMEVVYWQNARTNIYYLDSLYSQFSKAAQRRYEVGETNYLETLTATSKLKEYQLLLSQTEENIVRAYYSLKQWMQTDTSFTISESVLIPITPQDSVLNNNPGIRYYQQAVITSEKSVALEKQKLYPDLEFKLFRGTNTGPESRYYNGIEAGIGIPIWFKSQQSKIKASRLQSDIIFWESKNYERRIQSKAMQLKSDIRKYEQAITNYSEFGKTLSYEIINNAIRAFANGEIDFLQYVQLLDNAKTIEMTYLANLYQYNRSVLEYTFLSE